MRVSRAGLVTIALCAAVIGVFLLRTRLFPQAQPPSVEPPMLSHDGARVTVRDGSPLQKRLTVRPVSQGDGQVPVPLLPGQVVALPDSQVSIYSPVAGRIVEVDAHLYKQVSRGEVLAVVASGDFDQAWADDRKARAALDLAKRAYARASAVQAVGGNAVKDLESARNDLTQAQAEEERARLRLESIGARSDYDMKGEIPIVSPIDGVVSVSNISPGQNITDTTTVQLTLLNLSAVWISISVPDDLVDDLPDGQPLDITFPSLPGRHCKAPIDRHDPTVHADTRRMNIVAVCRNPDGMLRPGMFANATASLPVKGLLRLPKAALLMNNDQVSVFVERAPNVYERRDVTINYDEGNDVAVLSGLSAGERVVTSGGILLNGD